MVLSKIFDKFSTFFLIERSSRVYHNELFFMWVSVKQLFCCINIPWFLKIHITCLREWKRTFLKFSISPKFQKIFNNVLYKFSKMSKNQIYWNAYNKPLKFFLIMTFFENKNANNISEHGFVKIFDTFSTFFLIERSSRVYYNAFFSYLSVCKVVILLYKHTVISKNPYYMS